MSAPSFLPYGRQTIDDADVEAVVEVLRSDWLTQGPAVERFEGALAQRCGARHAVALANGTAALHLAALAAGIGPGQRVATSALTFVASANCIRYAGGEPVFVDIDAATLNLDPRALADSVEADPSIRGVVVVHFAGCPADLEAVAEVMRARGGFVIEDASHALGSAWRDGGGTWRPVGSCSHAHMATLSFHPVKHLTTGEGGAVLTNDDAIADRVRVLRTHGIVRDPARMERVDGPWSYEMQELGFNYRITDFQCALGLAQLARLDGWIERRRQIVARYRRALADEPRVRFVVEPPWARPAWHLFTVEVPGRAEVYRHLRERGIGVQVHYAPVHLQPYYRRLLGTREGDCPRAERYASRALSLPLYPALTDADVDRVVAELIGALDAVT